MWVGGHPPPGTERRRWPQPPGQGGARGSWAGFTERAGSFLPHPLRVGSGGAC